MGAQADEQFERPSPIRDCRWFNDSCVEFAELRYVRSVASAAS